MDTHQDRRKASRTAGLIAAALALATPAQAQLVTINGSWVCHTPTSVLGGLIVDGDGYSFVSAVGFALEGGVTRPAGADAAPVAGAAPAPVALTGGLFALGIDAAVVVLVLDGDPPHVRLDLLSGDAAVAECLKSYAPRSEFPADAAATDGAEAAGTAAQPHD